MSDRPDHAGHRRRLRQRFLEGGPDALPDYELLELVLFSANARADMKPVAKALLKRFGSFADVIAADPSQLMAIKGVGESGVVALKAIAAAARRLVRADATAKPVMSSWESVLDYCRAAMAHEAREQFRLLFLNRKNMLIADEVQQEGTVDQTAVYPREVVKRALELDASAIIMVHNHPSGDPTPSQTDIAMTREVRDAAAKLGIALHDHLIVSPHGTASLKGLGLI